MNIDIQDMYVLFYKQNLISYEKACKKPRRLEQRMDPRSMIKLLSQRTPSRLEHHYFILCNVLLLTKIHIINFVLYLKCYELPCWFFMSYIVII